MLNIAKKLDYIRDPQDDFKTYLDKANKYGFRCIFARTKQEYEYAVNALNDDIIIAGAIDFPEGVLTLEEKVNKFKEYALIGYKEIDYVLNQNAVENGNLKKIEEEMFSIHEICQKYGIAEKVIVEMCKLEGRDNIKREICNIANRVKPTFLKTSTGRSFRGADLNDVKLMKNILDDNICIKASGGIRTYQQAEKFFKSGADVIGASSAIQIVEESKRKMLNFDENRVRTEHQNGVNLIPEVEKIVDKVCEDGYSNIFLFGIGGTLLYAGQIMHTAKQLGCDLPIYLENATDFLYEGNAKFNEKSIVVIASLSGNTIEIEAAIDKAHEVGAKVMGYVEVLNSPLAKKVDYLVNTFGGEYYWWYSVVLRFMKNAGQFDKYDQLMNEIKNMPENVVQIYKDADAKMEAYAKQYCDEPITYLVASGNLENWAVCYGMCIMEEMQWMRTRPISAANFFHGTLEVIERDIPVILIKGEDKTRPEMDRVENFVHRVSAKVTVFDTKDYELKGISDEFRGILSPIMMRSAFMRLNVHLEHCRRHPIDIRRYYKALDY